MPAITAKFEAQLGEFKRELDSAVLTVTGLENATKRVGSELNRFGKQFSGAQIIRQAETAAKAVEQIGGVTKLTAAEQRRLTATVTEAVAKYRALGQEVPQSLRQLTGELSGVEQQTASAGKSFRDLFVIDIAKGVELATQAVRAAVGAFGDLVQRGTELTAIRVPFETFAGGAEAASGQLEVMRRSTLGLADDLSLMQAANKASLLGLTAMGVDLGELTGVATTLGRAMGQDATKSVDDLTTALGRGSVMILDNLGISLKLSDAYTQYAAQIGTTAEALTEEEKKQAFVTVAMEKAREKVAALGEVQLTLGDRAHQSTIEAGRFYDQMAENLATNEEANRLIADLGTFVKEAFGGEAAMGAERFNEAVSDIADTLRTEVLPALQAVIQVATGLGAFLNQLQGDLDRVARALNRLHPGQVGQQLGQAVGTISASPLAPGVPVALAPRAPEPIMLPSAEEIAASAAATRKWRAEAGELSTNTERVTESTKKLTAAQHAAAQAAKAHHEQIAKLTGADIVNQGKALAAVLADVPASLVDPRQIDAIRAQLVAAWEAAERLGTSTEPFRRELAKIPLPLSTIYRDVTRISSAAEELPPPFAELHNVITNMVQPLQVTYQNVRTINNSLQPLPNSFEKIAEAEEEAARQAEEHRASIAAIGDSIGALNQAFANLAQVSGGALGGFLGDMATAIGYMDAAGQSMQVLTEAQGQWAAAQTGAGKAAAGVGMAAGAVGAAGAFMGATEEGGASGALAGAAAGAQIGMIAGPWGAAIGAGVGAIVGALRSPGYKEEIERVGNEWGVTISKELAKSLDAQAKDVFGGSRLAAEAANLGSILAEAGGLSSANIEMFSGKLRSAFSIAEMGELTGDQLQGILEQNFGAFAAFVQQSSDLATREFQDVLSLADRFQVTTAQMQQFVGQQTGAVGAGLQAMLAPVIDRFDEYEEKIAAAQQAGDQAGLDDLMTRMASSTKIAAGELERLGVIAAGSFAAAQASGLSMTASVDQLTPSLAAITGQADELGITIKNAAFRELLDFSTLVQGHRALVDSTAALADTMQALTSIGGLNIDTLKAMETQGDLTFTRLRKSGFSQNEALAMMAEFLNNIRQGHEQLGTPIDANTQKLIDQAEAAGFLKSEEESLVSVMKEGMGALIEAVGGELPAAWMQAADSAAKSAKNIAASTQDVQRAIDGIKPRNIQIGVEYDIPEAPRGAKPRKAQYGAVVGQRGPELVWAGEGGLEAIVPLSGARMAQGRSQGGPIHLQIDMDGRTVTEVVFPHLANRYRLAVR